MLELERSLTMHIFQLFHAYGLCMNYVMLLLVSCMGTYRDLLHFVKSRAGFTPKIVNQTYNKRTFSGFITSTNYARVDLWLTFLVVRPPDLLICILE